jgi:hypothetical protein
MAGDISRSSFQPGKGNTGVRMQQGRVLLDADWNEQLDIQAYRERTLTTDLLVSAAPEGDAGFAITTDGQSLIIGTGRIYVEGILCENAQQCTVMPTPPPPPSSPSSPTEPPNPGMSIIRPLRSFTERVDIAQKAKFALEPLKLASTSFNVASAFNATSAFTVAGTKAAPASAPAAAPSSAPATGSAAATPALPVQPYLPSFPGSFTGAYTYLAYLDVWERDITALEDPSIREIALGGPDTTTRTRVVWQAKLLPYFGGVSCPLDIYDAGGFHFGDCSMSARAAATDPSSNPCVIPASAGYRSLENQMYRVEVHSPGTGKTATFKWSRDNASVVVGWQSGDGDLSVTSLGRDDVLGFAGGQWVELTDDSHEYAGLPGTLVQLSNAELVGQVPTLTIDTTTAASGAPLTFASFPTNPKVRRWDQTSAATLQGGAVPITEGAWIDLENGVQVFFAPGGNYHTGDYWLIPARTATSASQPTVIWPVDASNTAQLQAPQGIIHHLTSLAMLNFDGKSWSVLGDCRRIFAPITSAPAAKVAQVHTLDSMFKFVTPGIRIAPLDLLAGIQIFFDRPIDGSKLNVSTVTINLDLPATDERFAETATTNEQVPAAMTVKALGAYSASGGDSAVWQPFASTRKYILTRLAAFGALTAGQGLAQLRLEVQTAGILHDTQDALTEASVFTLSAWAQPYTDPSYLQGPIVRILHVYGPDASGDYLAFGYMTAPIFNQMMQLPALDVAGNKIYARPFQMAVGVNVYAYVPTPLERQGNFSAFSLPISDPNGTPFPGNVIPPNDWPLAGRSEVGLFAWRFRGYVPAPSAYSAYYGYAGGSAIGGELI